MIKVGILGASGYGGGELMRWLLLHPEAKVTAAVSQTYAGKHASAAFSGLAKRTDLVLSGDDQAVADCDLVFLASSDESAMCLGPEIVARGQKMIDLSPTFRFRDPKGYETWYKTAHRSPDLSAKATYGLPELHKEEIKSAQIVGNPGCYATTSILSLAPALSHGLIDPSTIVIDGKSGVSGAGRSKFGLDYHYSEANESVTAYKIAGSHRHTGEIEQELSFVAGKEVTISFTPHLIPMTRGILASSYATLTDAYKLAEIKRLYTEFYQESPFVVVVDGIPATKHCYGSNMAHIGLGLDERTRRLTIIAVIDNLGKGMAGQAIQNMNLMFGLAETTGLEAAPLWP
jgi:N-acetyl-gamma-glutamyl-phosphate reductase